MSTDPFLTPLLHDTIASQQSFLKQPKNNLFACSTCKDEGIVFSLSARKQHISYLEICSCIDQACLCDKKPPYVYLDPKEHILKQCTCYHVRQKLSRIILLFKRSNIPVKYRYRRFSEFITRHEDSQSSSTLSIALDNAHHFVAEAKNCNNDFVRGWYFYGPSGAGKTFLGCLMLNECILQHQIASQYVKITRDFFNRIRSSYNQESSYYGKGDDLFQTFVNIDLMVLDDLGIQKDSRWEIGILYDLLDARYELEKATIITSNMEPKNWGSVFENRIYSRLKEMVRFQDITVPDYRDHYLA